LLSRSLRLRVADKPSGSGSRPIRPNQTCQKMSYRFQDQGSKSSQTVSNRVKPLGGKIWLALILTFFPGRRNSRRHARSAGRVGLNCQSGSVKPGQTSRRIAFGVWLDFTLPAPPERSFGGGAPDVAELAAGMASQAQSNQSNFVAQGSGFTTILSQVIHGKYLANNSDLVFRSEAVKPSQT